MANRILAFVHAYVGHGREAGAETTLANLLESLVRNGWEADVLLNKAVPGGNYSVNGVNVISDTSGGKTFPKIADDYDIIISHLECSEQAAIVCRRSKIPIVHLVHNTFWQTEGYLATGTDLAVYNTNWVAEHHSNNQKNNVMSVPSKNGKLGTISFTARQSKDWPYVVLHPQIIPSDYEAEGPHDSIGMVNLYENKNPAIFYEMARRFPDQQFLGVIGGYGKQEIDDSLPNVEFIANTVDIQGEFYSRVKILLVPSHYESFGRVALEAAASGIPCIASPTQGLMECLGHRGVYADATDPDAWEVSLKELLIPSTLKYYRRMALNCSRMWADRAVEETHDLNVVLTDMVDRRRMR